MSDEELIARLREGATWDDDIAAADRIEALTAKLATCEKYRDAYAECDRIGTQAVRDLEAKLAKAAGAIQFWLDAEEPDIDKAIALLTSTLAEIKGT